MVIKKGLTYALYVAVLSGTVAALGSQELGTCRGGVSPSRMDEAGKSNSESEVKMQLFQEAIRTGRNGVIKKALACFSQEDFAKRVEDQYRNLLAVPEYVACYHSDCVEAVRRNPKFSVGPEHMPHMYSTYLYLKKEGPLPAPFWPIRGVGSSRFFLAIRYLTDLPSPEEELLDGDLQQQYKYTKVLGDLLDMLPLASQESLGIRTPDAFGNPLTVVERIVLYYPNCMENLRKNPYFSLNQNQIPHLFFRYHDPCANVDLVGISESTIKRAILLLQKES